MNRSIRLKPLTSLFASALLMPALLSSCSEDDPLGAVRDAACCEDFKVGVDLSGADFGLEGQVKGQFLAFAQAGSDLAAVASATLNDVSIACENIARDLGADVASAEGKTGQAGVTAWCNLATAQINAKLGARANVSLSVNVEPPRCTASVEAAADCQASCSVTGACDLEANPPSCQGGRLTVECGGSCTAEANAAVSCTGSCEGTCSGSCTVAADAPAISCAGRCEGTCSANANGGGNGTEADGTCNGYCKGTCTPSNPELAVNCQGTCEGSCKGSCTAAANAKFTCDGSCEGAFEAPRCEGGTLKVACDVDADCQANCNARVNATAECHPPSVAISYAGNLDAEAQLEVQAAIASLEANLPNLFIAVKARGTAFLASVDASVTAGGRIVADPGELSGEAVGCSLLISETIVEAAGNFRASITAAAKVTASFELNDLNGGEEISG